MRRALLIELRRSSVRWFLPLITGFQLFMLFYRSEQWEFAWSEASAAIGVAGGISVPLVAAAAAWEGTRWHRSGDLSVLHHHARFPGAGYALHQLSVLILATVPLLITTVTAWAVTAAHSGMGALWPSYLLLALAVQWLGVGLGFAAGRLLATRLVVPGVALCLMVPLLLMPSGHPFALFSISGPSGVVLIPQATLARIMMAAAVLALGVAVVGKHRDSWIEPRRGWTLTAGCVAVFAIAVQTMSSGGPLHAPRDPTGVTPVCTDTAVEICVWPDQAGFLPELTGYAQRIEALGAFADVPDRYVDANLDDSGFRFTLRSATGSWMRVSELAFAIDIDAYPDECTPDAELDFDAWSSQLNQLNAWYVHWIFDGPPPPGNGGGPPYDRAAMTELIAQPVQEQFEWAERVHDRVMAERPCHPDEE